MPNRPGTELQPPESPSAPATSRGLFQVSRRRRARIVFTTALAAIGLWVARDFLIPLGWAVILAVALWPLYRLFVERIWHDASVLPPLLFTVTICLVLIVPLGFAAVEVGREGQAAVEWLRRA